MAAAAPASFVKEVLPHPLTSTSEPPPLYDGTTRLYVAYHCPYAQRAWVARDYKGLQDKIKIVAIDLADRPAWYKEKVYPENKVPSLEHNNQVKGESLDLVKYIDSNFEGPALLPDDSTKQQFAEELLAYTGAFNKALFSSIVSKEDVSEEAVAALDKIEAALGKFGDGPFFLGQFSLVDIAYVPFIERFQIFFSDIKNYDITKGRSSDESRILPNGQGRGATGLDDVLVLDWNMASMRRLATKAVVGLVATATTGWDRLIGWAAGYAVAQPVGPPLGRPNLQKFIKEVNKIDAYTRTKQDPQFLLDHIKEKFGIA